MNFLLGFLISIVLMMIGFIIGCTVSYFYLKKVFQRQSAFLQKKFAEVSKKQIKNVLSSLGRKPSEAQINRIINLSNNRSFKSKEKRKKKKKR